MHRIPFGAFALSALFVASAVAVQAQDYKKSVIYQVVTDRFYDGSTANDNPSQSAGCMTPTGLPKTEAAIPVQTGRPIGWRSARHTGQALLHPRFKRHGDLDLANQ